MSTMTDVNSQKNSDAPQYAIKVYNTLTRSKETFTTIEAGKVGIYLCGPTVYKEAHIGHLVGPIIFDTIARYLSYCGYEVNWVVNITDVDDKLIEQSQLRKIPMSQVATEMTMDYCANLLEVGVDQITSMPKATENMEEIISFIEELIAGGFAYSSDGDVFFEVTADKEYGKLTNRSPGDQQGEGGGAASKKKAPGDFALWKNAKPGEPSWSSPWGEGRPGWHIECSAMSRRLLGKTFDIHGGGLDLTFPHHENEIAQSECCHGAPMAKYWLHNGLLRKGASGKIGGQADRQAQANETADSQSVEEATSKKMSRSGGAGGLRTLLETHGGEKIRFFLLRTHYRSTIVFDDAGLEEASTALDKFYTFFERYERITNLPFYLQPEDKRSPLTTRQAGEANFGNDELSQAVSALRQQFLNKMDDDFNTGAAVSELFQLLSILNRYADQHQLEDSAAQTDEKVAPFKAATETLRELSMILGLFKTPPKKSGSGESDTLENVMQLMIELRAEARKNKNFEIADRIRTGLEESGITLKDGKEGTRWSAE